MSDDFERPAREPEIIPPDRAGRPRRDPPDMRVFVDFGGTRRMRVVRLGPFGALAAGLLIAAAIGFLLLLLAGAVLIAVPLAVVFVLIALLSALLRAHLARRA